MQFQFIVMKMTVKNIQQLRQIYSFIKDAQITNKKLEYEEAVQFKKAYIFKTTDR